MHRLLRSFVLVVVVASGLGGLVPAGAAADRGTFGFSVEVDGDGFLDPVLKSVTVVSVVPASPAAVAGIAPRDRIVEAEGHAVVGAKARDLEPLLQRNVGEAVRLKLRRPDGDEYRVALVAVPRGAKP